MFASWQPLFTVQRLDLERFISFLSAWLSMVELVECRITKTHRCSLIDQIDQVVGGLSQATSRNFSGQWGNSAKLQWATTWGRLHQHTKHFAKKKTLNKHIAQGCCDSLNGMANFFPCSRAPKMGGENSYPLQKHLEMASLVLLKIQWPKDLREGSPLESWIHL